MAKAMRGRMIVAKYPGKCWECGAPVTVGQTVKWYGQGRVYGTGCCGVHNGFQTQTVTPAPVGRTWTGKAKWRAATVTAFDPPNGEDQYWIDAMERRADAMSDFEQGYA